MSAPAAKGPLKFLLQTPAGQYVVLGAGAYSFFPEPVQKAIKSLVSLSPSIAQFADGAFVNADRAAKNSMAAPIIIHTPSPTVVTGGRKGGWTLIMVVGAGTACWVGYVACVQLLPEAMSQWLPVTRKALEESTRSLGNSLTKVKEALQQQITKLSNKQDQLGKKQDETNHMVSHIKGEVGKTRIDLSMLKSTLDRCEDSLDGTKNLQQYTLRGVQLLMKGVANILPDDGNFLNDLTRYLDEGGSDLDPDLGASVAARARAANSTPVATSHFPSTPTPTAEAIPMVDAVTVGDEKSMDAPDSSTPSNYTPKALHALLGH